MMLIQGDAAFRCAVDLCSLNATRGVRFDVPPQTNEAWDCVMPYSITLGFYFCEAHAISANLFPFMRALVPAFTEMALMARSGMPDFVRARCVLIKIPNTQIRQEDLEIRNGTLDNGIYTRRP